MLKIGILLAGVIVCLPALAVAIFLRDLPGATVAALTAFGVIFSPFVGAALYAGRLGAFFREAEH
jgi:hypothetical protein